MYVILIQYYFRRWCYFLIINFNTCKDSGMIFTKPSITVSYISIVVELEMSLLTPVWVVFKQSVLDHVLERSFQGWSRRFPICINFNWWLFFNVTLVDLSLLVCAADCSVLIASFSFGTSLFVGMLVIAALPVVGDGFEWKAECSMGLKINRLLFGDACAFLSSAMKQPARSSKLFATSRISHWSIKSFTLACSGSLSLYFSKTTGILSFWQIEKYM